MDAKKRELERVLRELGSTLVAFSGGLDSGYLLHVAHRVLGDRAVALTTRSPSLPQQELLEAQRFCQRRGIRQVIVDSHEIENPSYAANPENRCYYCKAELFDIASRVASDEGLSSIVFGAITDDLGDHRPGMEAARERRIRAPLVEAGLSKAEIRELARGEGIEIWDKPSFACLASRFPYGTSITREKLSQIERCESAVRALGFRQIRARYHGDLVRLEVEPNEISRLASPGIRETVVAACRAAGFLFVSLDLVGYRTGSLNESLRIL
jgi:uncharacterized protein